MRLNELTKKAWAKLSKTCWSNQKAIEALSVKPLTLESFYLGRIKKLSVDNVMDEERVKLIELFTCKNQVVLGNNSATQKSAQVVNRNFVFDGTEKQGVDFILLDFSKDDQDSLAEFVTYAYSLLKAQGYLAMIVSDYRDKTGYHLFHARVADALISAGFSLQGLMTLIRDQQRLKPYGYPKTYVPNITQQFVVIARRI